MTDFDYSGLHADLTKLSKPAQRALVTYGVKTPQQLARHTLKEIMALHGIGPASRPKLQAALKKHGLKFKV